MTPMRWACAVAAFIAGISAASAAERAYPPLSGAIANPERGFWRFVSEDFAKVENAELADLSRDGMTLGYAVVRLDDFRDRPLSAGLLRRLDMAFARTRRHGVKVILRFAYNYPDDEFEYRNAKDAPLPVALGQIAQLRSVLAKNADVIAVLQAGFIGAWGEGHTSSNGLTTRENKAMIRDALLKALPEGRMLQWRYPPDVMRWSPAPPRGGSLVNVGLHNDCFMSSDDDVGTYSENPAMREAQRDYAAKLTRATFFSGETCDVGSGEERRSCDDIRSEGARFHLSALNRDYSKKFIRAWREGGCLDEVGRKMGHRLLLIRARATDSTRPGGAARIVVQIANRGWARIYNPRPLRLFAIHRSSGRRYALAARRDIRSVEPENAAPTAFAFLWRVPSGAPSGVYDLELALPDAAPSIASDPRYAVRFANGSGEGFGWNAETGRYALGLSIRVSAE